MGPTDRLRLTSAALVASNLVPLAGAAFGGWDAAAVLLTYWAESAVVGGFGWLRMLVAWWRGRPWAGPGRGNEDAPAPVMLAVFPAHFGAFMFGHLLFLGGMTEGPDRPFGFGETAAAGLAAVSPVAVLGFVAGHGISYAVHYLGVTGGEAEWRRTTVSAEMGRPYGRIVPMHLGIILGGFAFAGLGLRHATAAAVVLVLVKVGIDLASHVRGHRDRQRERPRD